MAYSVKLEPIEQDIRVLLKKYLSPQAKSRELARFAGAKLTEALTINARALGRAPLYETFVDGKLNAPLATVKPNGRIVFEFNLLDDTLFPWIGDMLVKFSPVGTIADRRPGHPGLYRASHVFTADGERVMPGTPVPHAQEYAFVNTQPYARKIERGLSTQAPDGVYDVVAAMANSKFSKLARIAFSYRSPLFGDINSWADSTTLGRAGDPEKRAMWLRRQPAIVIRPK